MSWDSGHGDGTVSIDRVITKEIKAYQRRQGDVPYPDGFSTTNSTQTIAAFPQAILSGNYTLTFGLEGEAPFTTANIDNAATASTIESAIDTAATLAGVTDWTNGDIDVVLVNDLSLGEGPMTLTYNGSSVSNSNPDDVIINDIDLDSSPVGIVTTPINGGVGVDEVQRVATYVRNPTSGSFTLNFNLLGPEVFNTANIAFNANAATIESAIDVAAAAHPIGLWSNGDIAVTGGPLTEDAIVLTFSGSTVDEEDHSITAIADVDLDGHVQVGEVSSTSGQTNRTALAALQVMGLIDSAPPPQGSATGITAASTRQTNPFFPSQETLQALSLQASIEDGVDELYSVLMTELGLGHML
jgi:hypothetical protein